MATRLRHFSIALTTFVCVAALAGCGSSADAESAGAATTGRTASATTGSVMVSTGAADATAGAAYCTSTGGVVEQRQPTYNTNGPSSGWVPLGDPVPVCHYVAVDKSRIYLDLVTLSSTTPTLAALAYLAKIPLPSNSNGANPAAIGCAALAGTSQFGSAAAAGGGLVDTDDIDFTVVNPCTFADGSFIDEWGIAYYSNGAVRGKDLATVFRFDQTKLPSVFSAK